MLRNLLIAFSLVVISAGCATPQGKLTTALDYFPGKKGVTNTPQNLEHNLNFARTRGYVLHGKYSGESYPGFSFTATNRNNLFSFKLMMMVSKDHLESIGDESVKVPEEVQQYVPIKDIAKIETRNQVRDLIFVPSITVPLLRYELKLGFGSEPNVNTSLELRSGLAYDFHAHYYHSDYRISLFDGGEKKIVLPRRVSDDGYYSYISSVNLDIAPLHLGADLVVNAEESKVMLGVGLVW